MRVCAHMHLSVFLKMFVGVSACICLSVGIALLSCIWLCPRTTERAIGGLCKQALPRPGENGEEPEA